MGRQPSTSCGKLDTNLSRPCRAMLEMRSCFAMHRQEDWGYEGVVLPFIGYMLSSEEGPTDSWYALLTR